MLLGIYVYRGSIVLIGWGTALVILLFIESFFIFVRGIPNATINLVLALTIITAFFVGYILGYFPKAGLFCMGMWIGIIITLTLNNVCLYFINSNPSNLSLYIVMPILAIGFGVLILFIKRTFIIFASCIFFHILSVNWSLFLPESTQLEPGRLSQLVSIVQAVSLWIGSSCPLAVLSLRHRPSYPYS